MVPPLPAGHPRDQDERSGGRRRGVHPLPPGRGLHAARREPGLGGPLMTQLPASHWGLDVPGMSAADHAELDSLLELLAADTWPPDIDEARRFYDAWGTPVAPDITVDEREVGGVPAFLLTPPAADSTPDRALAARRWLCVRLAAEPRQHGGRMRPGGRVRIPAPAVPAGAGAPVPGGAGGRAQRLRGPARRGMAAGGRRPGRRFGRRRPGLRDAARRPRPRPADAAGGGRHLPLGGPGRHRGDARQQGGGRPVDAEVGGGPGGRVLPRRPAARPAVRLGALRRSRRVPAGPDPGR